MSTNDVVKIKSAYEKMLQDGTAFKEVDMSMTHKPDVSMAEGGLGDRVDEQPQPSQNTNLQEDNTDFADIDSRMSERMNALRNKVQGNVKQQSQMNNPQKELLALKIKVAKLEEALILVMETHEKLLG